MRWKPNRGRSARCSRMSTGAPSGPPTRAVRVRGRHCIMKLLEAALRADPPGPVAEVVAKNSCPFGSDAKNACW